MAFRFYNDQGFAPLFRLLDDFDSYRGQQGSQQHNGKHQRSLPTFQPRFDVREVKDAFELHGELPGMQKENVEIEFTDPHTMMIRGRIERTYQSGTPPAGLVEDTEMSGAITVQGEEPKKDHSHKATVEDEAAAETPTSSPEAPAADVVKQDKKKDAPKDGAKYWVSERSIGEFSRTFTFPGHIDQHRVNASLKDGVLSVIVPKAKKPEAHRVAIN
jgi:HSP20 family molecular chaperone IbpA